MQWRRSRSILRHWRVVFVMSESPECVSTHAGACGECSMGLVLRLLAARRDHGGWNRDAWKTIDQP